VDRRDRGINKHARLALEFFPAAEKRIRRSRGEGEGEEENVSPARGRASIASVVRNMHNSSETRPRHGNSGLTRITAGEFTSADADDADADADAACPIRTIQARTYHAHGSSIITSGEFQISPPAIPLLPRNSPQSSWRSPVTSAYRPTGARARARPLVRCNACTVRASSRRHRNNCRDDDPPPLPLPLPPILRPSAPRDENIARSRVAVALVPLETRRPPDVTPAMTAREYSAAIYRIAERRRAMRRRLSYWPLKIRVLLRGTPGAPRKNQRHLNAPALRDSILLRKSMIRARARTCTCALYTSVSTYRVSYRTQFRRPPDHAKGQTEECRTRRRCSAMRCRATNVAITFLGVRLRSISFAGAPVFRSSSIPRLDA